MKKCIICSKDLMGRQTKYCSNVCKCKETNKKYQRYLQQKERGIINKMKIFLSRGGKCEECGYNKNLAAIDFHHVDPSNKSFQIDLRVFANSSLERILKEIEKCVMICANCHREHHNPSFKLS
jgi:hypothetical protein